MSALPIMLADEDTDAVLQAWRLANPSTREGIIIFGALGLVTVLVLFWAIFLRRRRQRRRSHHHSHQHSSEPAGSSNAPAEDSAPLFPQKRHKRNRLRRRHRPRNPTLAETGGLPPIRPENPPETPS
jgi:hypothetical protein